MKKQGKNYVFSESELKTLLSNTVRSGIRDFSGNIGEIALEIMGFEDDEIDDIQNTEEDIDALISRILTKPSERIKLKKELSTGTYRGCGGGAPMGCGHGGGGGGGYSGCGGGGGGGCGR